jgi:ribosome biogenesis GTPase A
MAKAKRQIAEVMPKIDVVIEVLDARLPVSSANPMLEKLRGQKPCIKVLNKSDLADPEVTAAWIKYFDQMVGVKAIPIEANKRSAVGQIPKLCRILAPHRGVPGKTLRAMVVGIPNVGKSTLINTLAGKKMAGLLWPDIRNQKSAYRLAASGAIGEGGMDYEGVSLFAAEFLMDYYPQPLAARYKFDALPESALQLVEQIGRKRGCLISGGHVDQQRSAELLLRELRSGLIGRVSLEKPGDDGFAESGE